MNIARQRCFLHRRREAVARCPECGRYYCRECVTEHAGRVVCADCLALLAQPRKREHPRLHVVALALQVAAAFFLLWVCFYGLGTALIRIPAAYHDATIWRSTP